MTTDTPLDGREIAAANELSILRQLNRFGWLTSRQLARLSWPRARYGLCMSQRTLRRLEAAGLVRREQLSTGGKACVLTARGVRRLRLEGIDTPSPKVFRDLRFANPIHRAVSNDFAIDWLLAGMEHGRHEIGAWTEFEIQCRRAPSLASPFNDVERKADLLLYQGKRYHWIEVERAPKSMDRLDKLIEFAAHLLGPQPADDTSGDTLVQGNKTVGHVDVFHFICATDASRRACIAAMRRYGAPALVACCGNTLIIQAVAMSPGLMWRGSRGPISVHDIFTDSRHDAAPSEEADDGD